MSEDSCTAMEQWLCPICRELLFKPVASPCGHVFCFWCIHHSMSPFQTSTCPICRSSFSHFPSIIPMLHMFLKASFPEVYRQRAEEARQEEEESEIASPQEICAACADVQSRPGRPSSEDFACDACGMLVYKPLILNCGHVVCMHHVDASHASDVGCCPRCQAPFHGGETQSTQLWDWMTSVFPKQCEERERQGVLVETPPEEKSAAVKKEEGEGEGMSGMDDNSNNDGDYPEDFTHFGIGCDICGQYPIVGKRYKCLDCPESVGFDLCKSCKKCGDTRVGRFNQKHKASHRLELVPPLKTKLHTIKELHPDLDYNRLLSLIEMAWEDHSSNPPQIPQEEDEANEQQEEEEEENEPMTDGSTMMRPRGPRPHHSE